MLDGLPDHSKVIKGFQISGLENESFVEETKTRWLFECLIWSKKWAPLVFMQTTKMFSVQ